MEATERVYRTKEERIAELEAKIEYHKKAIVSLEAKKETVLTPKTRKGRISVSSVVKIAKEKGRSPEEILEKLGLEE